MDSRHTRDLRLTSQNQGVLVPSIHGSPTVYYPRIPPAAFLDHNDREDLPCCFHARESEI